MRRHEVYKEHLLPDLPDLPPSPVPPDFGYLAISLHRTNYHYHFTRNHSSRPWSPRRRFSLRHRGGVHDVGAHGVLLPWEQPRALVQHVMLKHKNGPHLRHNLAVNVLRFRGFRPQPRHLQKGGGSAFEAIVQVRLERYVASLAVVSHVGAIKVRCEVLAGLVAQESETFVEPEDPTTFPHRRDEVFHPRPDFVDLIFAVPDAAVIVAHISHEPLLSSYNVSLGCEIRNDEETAAQSFQGPGQK